MKDGHLNICNDCNKIQGQKYRKKKSSDMEWVVKNRERRKKYAQSPRFIFSNIQHGHICHKYKSAINIIPRYQFHHWNYNLPLSVFYVHPSIHHKFHSLAKLNKIDKIYYFINEPLDSKEKHKKILDWINTHFEYNHPIIDYELADL
jgi:hypothetical protein